MTQTGEVTNRPGTALIKVGLVLALIGVLLTIAVVSAGGNLTTMWLVLAGLVLAVIGFGMRVLAALERR
jgi:hypothetical protein